MIATIGEQERTESAALRTEDVRCAAWQTCSLPEQSVIRDQVGYGKGSPWTEPSNRGTTAYAGQAFPIAKQVAERTTWIFNLYPWPNTTADTAYAVRATEKVFGQLEAVIASHRER